MKNSKLKLTAAAMTVLMIASGGCAGPGAVSQSAASTAGQAIGLSAEKAESSAEPFILDKAYEDLLLYPYPDRIVGKNQAVHCLAPQIEIEGVPKLPYSLAVLDSNASKELSVYSLDEVKDMNLSADEMDENGTLTNDCSYLQIKVLVTNESDQPNEVFLNTSHVITLPGTEKMMEHSVELRLLNNPQYPWESKSHGRYTFAPHEQAEFVYGFVVQDKYLQDPFLGLTVGGPATSWDDGNQRFILLN